jgi:hypothetical protein
LAIITYLCRFFPNHTLTPGRGELTEYLVPVEWWAYADDRLDARCPAKLTKAQVEVKAYSPEEARKLVVLEWGSYGKVGTPAKVTA